MHEEPEKHIAMNDIFFATLAQNYAWQLSLYTVAALIVAALVTSPLRKMVPAYREAGELNRQMRDKKMERSGYVQNLSTNRKWAFLFYVIIFAGIMPFCINQSLNAWWRLPVDIFGMLMLYDFFYYLTHRFMFHDYGKWKGPLLWVHAVHHRQHKICRADSGYIHPLETAIGLGLITGTMALYGALFGKPDVLAIAITWILYIELNLHNHDGLWQADHFPFKSLKYLSVMHSNHHRRFDAGNFGSITMFYDRLFGTLDFGQKKSTAPQNKEN